MLDEFEDISRLKANPAKSSLFCAGVNDEDKNELLDLMHMNEGTFPVRYLRDPLITKLLIAVFLLTKLQP